MRKILNHAIACLLLFLPTLLLSADFSSVALISCSNSGKDQGITAKTHGRVYFNDGKTGEIVLFCHVSEALHGKTIVNMELSAIDTIPGHAGIGVSAALRRVSKLHGNISSVPGATVSTEDSSCRYHGDIATREVLFCDKPIQPHHLNFRKYFYFYQVNLVRTHPTQNVKGIGVSLRTRS